MVWRSRGHASSRCSWYLAPCARSNVCAGNIKILEAVLSGQVESQRAWPTRCVVRRPFAKVFVRKAPAASFDIFPRYEYLHVCVCLCVCVAVLLQGNACPGGPTRHLRVRGNKDETMGLAVWFPFRSRFNHKVIYGKSARGLWNKGQLGGSNKLLVL